MTKEEKERKIKLIKLIIICDMQIMKKSNLNIFEMITKTLSVSMWLTELKITSQVPPFEKGCCHTPPRYIDGCRAVNIK